MLVGYSISLTVEIKPLLQMLLLSESKIGHNTGKDDFRILL